MLRVGPLRSDNNLLDNQRGRAEPNKIYGSVYRNMDYLPAAEEQLEHC